MKETGVVVSATELRARNSRLIHAARGGGTLGFQPSAPHSMHTTRGGGRDGFFRVFVFNPNTHNGPRVQQSKEYAHIHTHAPHVHFSWQSVFNSEVLDTQWSLGRKLTRRSAGRGVSSKKKSFEGIETSWRCSEKFFFCSFRIWWWRESVGFLTLVPLSLAGYGEIRNGQGKIRA